VPELCRAFLERARSSASLAPEALAALEQYAWPGNVRELEHLMERLSLLRVPTIRLEHLPRAIRAANTEANAPVVTPPRAAPRGPGGERAEVERALAASGGNISRAAALLGLTRQGLKKRMIRLGMRAPAGALEKAG
jgi:DNA-binding NtrC family response regulator